MFACLHVYSDYGTHTGYWYLEYLQFWFKDERDVNQNCDVCLIEDVNW